MSEAATPKYNPFADLAPDAGAGEPGALATLTRASEGLGFGRRSAPEVAVKRQRGTEKTVHQFTMRVAVASSNKFVLWCEKHRLSYREGFDRLVETLDDAKP